MHHGARLSSRLPPGLYRDDPRERGWKLKQCKRYAGSISKSNLGIEARAINREKQELEATRKRAAWVAKEVRHCGGSQWRWKLHGSGFGGGMVCAPLGLLERR